MPRKWGQHFLKHERYVHRMIKTAGIEPGESLLEIGPGMGMLTRHLLELAGGVTAVEIDEGLCQYLRERLTSYKFHLVFRDILTYAPEDWNALSPQPYKVIGNLAYNIASPLFFQLLPLRHHFQSLTFMVQKEWAVRLCAQPADGKEHAFLSVAATLGFDRQLAFLVPPQAFEPPPKVDSAVIHLVPRPCPPGLHDESAFLSWIQPLFEQRRKTLLNNAQRSYRQWYQSSQSELQQTWGSRRAESLSLEEWLALYQQFRQSQSLSIKVTDKTMIQVP